MAAEKREFWVFTQILNRNPPMTWMPTLLLFRFGCSTLNGHFSFRRARKYSSAFIVSSWSASLSGLVLSWRQLRHPDYAGHFCHHASFQYIVSDGHIQNKYHRYGDEYYPGLPGTVLRNFRNCSDLSIHERRAWGTGDDQDGGVFEVFRWSCHSFERCPFYNQLRASEERRVRAKIGRPGRLPFEERPPLIAILCFCAVTNCSSTGEIVSLVNPAEIKWTTFKLPHSTDCTKLAYDEGGHRCKMNSLVRKMLT